MPETLGPHWLQHARPPSPSPILRVCDESSGQSIGVSSSASVLPMNIQDLFPLGCTGWISCSPRDSEESSPTPQFKSINSLALSFLFNPTLTYIHGEGNKNSLQYSCLENPRDRGAWWAAVYGVAQSQTRLKQFSSSSSYKFKEIYTGYICEKLKNCVEKNQRAN